MASGDNIYPPDSYCFWDAQFEYRPDCSVTVNMVNFLNLTGTDYKRYLAAYCLNPPTDDGCPFGFCPNPDIAGLLVRIASE